MMIPLMRNPGCQNTKYLIGYLCNNHRNQNSLRQPKQDQKFLVWLKLLRGQKKFHYAGQLKFPNLYEQTEKSRDKQI